MSRFLSHINTAKNILQLYKGDVPFSVFIKRFFSASKKYGSRDRKKISHYCYVYFRVAAMMPGSPAEDVIVKGIFLCGSGPDEDIPEEWNQHMTESLQQKLERLGLNSSSVFPFPDLLSREIDSAAFGSSLLIQPSLFVRIRPGRKETVLGKFSSAGISFKIRGDDALELDSGKDLRVLAEMEKDIVVQDLSSQQVLDGLPELYPGDSVIDAWDCCAGSGGKTILLRDRLGKRVSITATDIRGSIISNFKKRAELAGVQVEDSKVADVSKGDVPDKKFSLIICDAPCSGSGTWSRTPEQMFYFRPDKLPDFIKRQKAIAMHSLPCLIPGGYFLYVTCSVFSEENEGVAEFISGQPGIKKISSGYIRGYDKKADTMYVALFQRTATA